jgi:Bacterial pre-peptidase C-terminal domain/Domain of unknown function (DUF4214)
MALFPRFDSAIKSNRRASDTGFSKLFRDVMALGLAALLFFAPLAFNASAQQATYSSKTAFSQDGDYFVLSQNAAGEVVCRTATMAQRSEMKRVGAARLGLHPINHFERESESYDTNSAVTNAQTGENAVAANLTIVLRASDQLNSFPEARAAFVRAAQSWENLIKSPVTIYLDVDYGPTFFGQPWETGVLGATSSPLISSSYSNVRAKLIATSSNSTELSLYNSLPTASLPTDLNSSTSAVVSASIGRAIGLLPAAASQTDAAAQIAFNSNLGPYDFDPSNGITTNQTDFEAIATHEIGHALGFTSRSGATSTSTTPAIWDFFRFRAGTTLGTFTNAQRILTAPNTQYYFSGGSDLALSTGGVNGDAAGGDGNQSSHWKQASLNGGTYIGIMDPRIPRSVHRPITSADINTLNTFGYNLEDSTAPPAPPVPANNAFANAQVITGCTATINATNIGADKETGEPSHNPDSTGHPGSASVWYQWQAPASGSVTVSTVGGQTNFDTMIGVYTGNSVGSLAVIGKNDDVAQGNTDSSLTFNAVAGTVYKIAVDGWGGEIGDFTLNFSASNCAAQPLNQIDSASFFVGQHYQDFLGRTADAGGLQYWSEQITGNSSNAPSPCTAGDARCEHVRRISVSAAFFVENEFQRTGGFVYRFYKASYGTRPTFTQFRSDRALVYEGDGLEARKQAFAANWVQRPEFVAKYPASMSGTEFVDALSQTVLINSGVDLSSQRASLINDFNVGGRAQVMRSVADNATLQQAEYNAAFVLMQYFGYLQRNPDDGGYQFWLGILNDRVPNNYRAMVCAFITSAEYQQRFGSVITRSNADCAFVGP